MNAREADTTAPRRRSVAGNVAAVGGLSLVLFVFYVLSYPVGVYNALPWTVGSPGPSFYRPVEWLIDNTPLREPILLWAHCCGVGEQAASMYYSRLFTRPLIELERE